MPIYFIKDQAIGPVFTTEQPAREAQLLADGYTRVDDPGQYSRETHTYVDGVFVSIPAPTAAEVLAQAQAQAKAQVIEYFESRFNGQMRDIGFTALDLPTWLALINEAKAYKAGGTATTTLLDAYMASGPGRFADKGALADRVIYNEAKMAQVVGAAAQKDLILDNIKAADSLEALQAVLASLPESLG